MVTTRSQYQAWLQERMQNSRRGLGRQWRKRYKVTDPSHRHRIPDEQPKTTRVVSYTRRT